MTSYQKDWCSTHTNSQNSGSQTAYRELLPNVSQHLQYKHYYSETNTKLKFYTKGISIINKSSAIWINSLLSWGAPLYTVFKVLLFFQIFKLYLHKIHQIFLLWNYIFFYAKKRHYLNLGVFLLQYLFLFRILVPAEIAQNAEQKLVEMLSRKICLPLNLKPINGKVATGR